MSPHTVAVVGAGAAGLTAALRAAESGASVTVLNAHPRIGLKILMSGGTRCNVTHQEVTERDFHGGSQHFIRSVLRAFTVEQTLEWFAGMGVELKLEDTGKYFPKTDDAQTVLDALLGAVAGAGVSVETGARVVRVERRDGGGFRLAIQRVLSSGELGVDSAAAVGRVTWPLVEAPIERWIEADAVVLATGGLSFPRTGSDGTGYSIVESLGHTIVAPVPALTPLAAEDPLSRAVQGVAVEAELRMMGGSGSAHDGRAVARGPLLFTHFGYSGPAALDLSRHWYRTEGTRRVVASFLPGEREETLDPKWVALGAREPRVTVRAVLARSMPDRLGAELAREAGVHAAALLSQVKREDRAKLVRQVLRRALPVTGTLGFEKAEVTAGGVPVEEVRAPTLESKVAPGLFLCGEVLDVEGRLGGFNFQWGWSSGTVAGRSAGGERV